ncbi:MAG: glycosyltransferase family 2 protein [Bacteroidota bacterium]
MKISVVIPVYNGAETITEVVNSVVNEFIHTDYEIILVNDGSKDQSEKVCEQISLANPNIKFISLRKNFGEHNAVICGLNYTSGDYSAIIDDDFQNPPSEIKKLLQAATEGDFDVVFSKYNDKKHHFFRNIGSKINDKIANVLLQKPKKLYLSSFKLINKAVVDEIVKYKGPFPYIDGLILRVTNNITSVEVKHHKRAVGKSNYTLKKLISLYFNMFFNFSVKPLRMFTIAGFIIFLVGVGFSIAFLIDKLLDPSTPAGWTSIIIAIITLSGFQIIFLGLIGEYLGKQYLDQNATPQWVVKKELLHSQEEDK